MNCFEWELCAQFEEEELAKKDIYLDSDHVERLKNKGELVMFEKIEIKSKDIGEEKYSADVDGKGANVLVDEDESVLVEVAEDRANSHPNIKKNIHLILTLLTKSSILCELLIIMLLK